MATVPTARDSFGQLPAKKGPMNTVPTAPTPWPGNWQPWMVRAQNIGPQASDADVVRTIYDLALRYLDPASQASTALWLARQHPKEYASYANLAEAAPEYTPELLSRSRILAAAQSLTPEFVKQQLQLPGAGTAFESTALPPLRWMQNYLNVAAQGIGESPVARATRAQERLAQARLQTLTEEAANAPHLAPYVTLAQNLVNPVLPRAPAAGGIGTARTIMPKSQTRRGLAERNISWT